ncbi:PhoP/PhoQ regulator MgrB [Moellerella wisconsensis]
MIKIKRLLIILLVIFSCLLLYLLALDNVCDQDGKDFKYGICQITDWLPF